MTDSQSIVVHTFAIRVCWYLKLNLIIIKMFKMTKKILKKKNIHLTYKPPHQITVFIDWSQQPLEDEGMYLPNIFSTGKMWQKSNF